MALKKVKVDLTPKLIIEKEYLKAITRAKKKNKQNKFLLTNATNNKLDEKYNNLDEKYEIPDDSDTELVNVEEIQSKEEFFNLALNKYNIAGCWYTAM